MIVALLRVQDGTKVAETSLKVTSPFRLGLVRPWEPQSRVTAKRKLTQQNIKPRLIIILTHDLIVIHWLKTDCHIGVATFVFFSFQKSCSILAESIATMMQIVSTRWIKLEKHFSGLESCRLLLRGEMGCWRGDLDYSMFVVSFGQLDAITSSQETGSGFERRFDRM